MFKKFGKRLAIWRWTGNEREMGQGSEITPTELEPVPSIQAQMWGA